MIGAQVVCERIDAHTFRERGEWFVTFTVGAAVVDEAGPFDDELDALEAARRGGELI